MLSSPPPHQRPRRISIGAGEFHRPSPPSPSSPLLSSLQAAATINAGLHNASPTRDPISVQRRRSSVLTNLLINDPTIPAPGEMQHRNGSNNGDDGGSPRLRRRSFADPFHHDRPPSLGELHSTLEQEQEAQVNRLLHQIRAQQEQLAALQAPARQDQSHDLTRLGMSSPPSSSAVATEHPSPRALANTGVFNRPQSLSRQSSRLSSTSSYATSPALRPVSGNGPLGPLTEDYFLGGRDESAFYKAETQNLTRENQMLKTRIRELERQVQDMPVAPQQQQTPVSSGDGS